MKIDFDKENGLVPAIIQNYQNGSVLMLGYMNREAYEKTCETKKVTFFSRSKQRLWTKGETSGNYLNVVSISEDCDNDALLILVNPEGPTCHTGTESCFKKSFQNSFLYDLEAIISDRITGSDPNSYTKKLVERGINKVAQKVGEEAVELVIEAKDTNTDLFLNEAADLLYHILILLRAKGTSLAAVEEVLRSRSR
ncbi:bifunctional phosphoribosyl-AMP cyclohydrolase/phosphoribosyl-ATP diphosphatase HisIE [Flavobacterium aurantiibacter]|uniref:Histidine biosynthesis bifunctional protein HisIE n=1 Tax=Flavobacterium aurantiibacter TaxID=2023067 RepID=A0A255ZVA8_9FLAO|nr:bifunctional phosphoribosyl-AMP cyclohydrolase/phosphoribosyl-ATP diphosphatase HisIE [Flavobacterium aurantiibacter]OYQ44845.1 bifunctional phosphoribosyl-AMP cyclohydrolase/phosphoribosyl-ATP diphosphatase [Flavobacterium aurantiibacter]